MPISSGTSSPSPTRAMPAGRAAGTGDAVTSSQMWNAGRSARAAYGFTIQTAAETSASTSASAAPAPGLSGAGRRPASRGRTDTQGSAKNSVQIPSVSTAAPSSGLTSGGSGTGGASGACPTSTRNSATASATRNGTSPAPIQRSHGRTGSWRRRTRAKASIAAANSGSSNDATSSAIAQRGRSFCAINRYDDGVSATRPPAS